MSEVIKKGGPVYVGSYMREQALENRVKELEADLRRAIEDADEEKADRVFVQRLLQERVRVLRGALEEIIRREHKAWKPMQVFRSDEEVALDEARHETWTEAAEILRAALAEADEPVRHRHEWFRTGAMEPGQMRCINCGAWARETHPPRREPLTLAQINRCWAMLKEDNQTWIEEFARAIERAHGIGGDE